MRSNKVFKVVVALTTQSYAGQRKLAGIFRFLSGKYLWDITLLRAASELTLDFTKLEYISSAGLRVLLSTQKTMNRQGKMVIRNVTPEVQEVFEITGFSDILTIE